MASHKARIWLLGVSLFGIAASAPVLAAEQAELQAVETDAPQQGSADDIVVTARRRAERLQDVPIAVQAFNEAAMARNGISRTEDLANVTPSLRVAPQSNGRATPVYELRGINSFDVLATQDPAVAVYVNDVYQARPVGTNQPMLDIESIQVLLGPQGTLFGRNATAGAILFTSKRPTDNFEGQIAATIGSYDRFDYSVVLNIPVSETLAIRAAGQRVKRDGYTIDLNTGKDYDDEDAWSGRLSLLWKPFEGFENLTIGDYYKADENGTSVVTYAARPTGAASRLYPNFQSLLAAQKLRGPRRVAYDLAPDSSAKAWGIANITTWEVGDNMTLKNVLGYRKVEAVNTADLDGTIDRVLQTTVGNSGWQISDELQLQGKAFDQALNYILGIYYFNEHSHYDAASFQQTSASTVNIPSITNTSGRNKSYSAFAQATYNIRAIEGLSVTAGVRYTRDERKAIYDNPTLGTPGRCSLQFITAGAACYAEVEKSFEKPSWTFSADYKIAPGKLIYIAQRRGYRSGGFNTRAQTVGQLQPFQPETVTDVEVGFKGDWSLGGDAKLRTNIAVYRNKYDDIQRNVAFFFNGTSTTSIINAASAIIKGFEANVTLQPVSGFVVSGYWGYVDAVHRKFDAVVGGVQQTYTNVPFGVAKNTYGAQVALTPIDEPTVGKITVSGNVAYVGSYKGTQQLPLFDPESTIPSRTTMNASIEWEKIGGTDISGQIFARNLLNENYVASVQSQQAAFGITSVTYGEPRMYGLTLKYAFGGN